MTAPPPSQPPRWKATRTPTLRDPAVAGLSRWTGRGGSAPLYLAVALGSAVGGTLRWGLSVLMLVEMGPGFPWGTLLVNVSGSFLIGVYAALSGPAGRFRASPLQRHFVMTGLLGGYTTFSIFSLETIRLLEIGRLEAAGLNVVVSVFSWLGAVWLGFVLGRRMNRHGRQRAPPG